MAAEGLRECSDQAVARKPLGKAWQNAVEAWDGYLHVAHAETRNKARSIIAREMDLTYLEATVRRLPAMDDLPVTAWNLLTTGSCGWHECAGCGRWIYSDAPVPTSVDPESGDDISAVEGPHGTAYCSAECYAREVAGREARVSA